jgi:hypothetical protein
MDLLSHVRIVRFFVFSSKCGAKRPRPDGSLPTEESKALQMTAVAIDRFNDSAKPYMGI